MSTALIALAAIAVWTVLCRIVRAHRKPKPVQCKHLWKVIGTERQNCWNEGAKYPFRHFTRVLQACLTCDDVKTIELEGGWSVAQVNEAFQYGNLSA